MKLTQRFFILCLFSCSVVTAQDKPVVIYVHGINDRCPIPSFEQHLQDFDYECIYLDRGDFGTVKTQANKGCRMLDQYEHKLKNGFTLVGFSQGGLLARVMLQTCKFGQYVRRFISIAGPQNGVAYTPYTDKNFYINWLAFMMCDKFLFRLFVVPCNYLKFVNHYQAYKNSKFELLDLNNELQVNTKYKLRIESLDFFINLSFFEDDVVTPYNSGNFGYYDDAGKSYIDFKQTEQYSKNLLGLRSLNDQQKFLRCEVHGAHVQVSDEQYKNLVVPFLDYRKHDYDQHWDYINKHCVYNQIQVANLYKNFFFPNLFVNSKILKNRYNLNKWSIVCINFEFCCYFVKRNLISFFLHFVVCFIHKKLNQNVDGLCVQEELFFVYFCTQLLIVQLTHP